MIRRNDSDNQGRRSQILVAEDLRKDYGVRAALRGLSFALAAGRVLGFLGPNGAGKTTAIRVLTTILEPTSGRFYIDGISSVFPESIRRRIGVLPESLGFPKNITGIEFLTFFGQLHGRTAEAARSSALALLEEVRLGNRATSLIGSYSRGMRQRLGIARALVNDPVAVFLDEPTLGLDPRGQHELIGLVRQIARERNAGVILCSHFLSEIEAVCDDVVILSSGRVVAKGTVADVLGQSQGSGIRIRVAPPAISDAELILGSMPSIRRVAPTGEAEGWLRVELADHASGISSQNPCLNNGILEALIRAEIPILSFEAEGRRLRDVFLDLTEEAIK